MSDPVSPESPRLSLLQQRISIITWAATLLLSMRGLFDFYGMKTKGTFEQLVYYATEPVVQLFQFDFIERLDIPAIAVCFATVCLLIGSYTIRFFIKCTELRLRHARKVLARNMISLTAK